MKIKWLNPDSTFSNLILAGDIGGTNSNLALVGESNGVYTIILEVVFPSAEINGIIDPIKKVLSIAKERRQDLVPQRCSISAAGAVINNTVNLTNCGWSIDGEQVRKETGLKTLLINDFVAISYGLLTYDVNDEKYIHQLQHPDGTIPAKQNTTIAVIGPGTGLGVSFLVYHNGEYIPASSEGGHAAFAPFDDESEAFCKYMRNKIGITPGIELFVSGQGVKNIFHFYKDCKNMPIEGLIADIGATPDFNKPGKISRGASENGYCRSIMQLYVRMFASAASNLACTTLPFGGLYLAGGTVSKDLRWLQEDDLFMKTFETNYNRNIVPLLKKIPVYVILDYSISLYGAANAGMKINY
ncbi:MAG TPA: glucokinase [Chitinispirillaceae bacterium]|nr:glucokinase [Chitinispirillaceae bacterium]